MQPPNTETKSTPAAWLNWTSLTGLFLALLGLFIGSLTLLLDFLSGQSQSYTGLLYLLYTGLVALGLTLLPLGVTLERRRRRVGGQPSFAQGLIIDFRNSSHRKNFIMVFAIATLLLLIVVVGSYKTYHATETNGFCGQLCHTVMTPEYTSYGFSSHAKVDCVECHIGAGSTWYVRSKFSGIRQIFAVALNTFPRPIPTPIENLRPARETCEECHWPNKFIGYKDVVRSYYLADEENTQHRIRMLMKIGGEEHSLMRGSGIHYHMLLANKVEYIARDHKRQDIAWVKVTHGDGTSETFENTDEPLTEDELNNAEVRTMDCMDCHNRPSHQFPAPMKIVNQALDVGAIDLSLPRIKEQSVMAMDQDYPDLETAKEGIRTYLMDYYTEEYPDVMDNQLPLLLLAIEEVQALYERSIFPQMKASWAYYPDNIGHRDWPGCFRCHNDRMENENEKTIFTTCYKCHLILAQGENIDHIDTDLIEGLNFVHPGEDGEEIDEYTECTDCHTGGKDVYE